MSRAARTLLILAAVAALGIAMARLPGRAARAVKRATASAETDAALADARYVDMGVVLHVVRMDLERGVEMIDGCPPMVLAQQPIRLGGIVDTAGDRPRMVGPSRSPAFWYCSEDAAPIILHGEDLPDRILLYGSEGAGKTRVLAQWLGVRVIEGTGSRTIHGITSPTEKRAEEIREAIAEMWPPHWMTWHERRRMYVCANGQRAQIVSTYQQSKKAGSRVQGFNWRDAASDEIQDSLEKDADIEMRGRKAPLGRYKRLCTATSKDSSDFRDWRDKRLAGKLWVRRTLLGTRSPFVWPKFWQDKAETLDKREYRRRILAEDLPPENRVYYGFERDRNVRPLPQIARDVTAEVASIYRPYTGRNRHVSFALIAGHDPGEIVNVTHFLRAFYRQGEVQWFVVGRFITHRTTAEQHAKRLRAHVQTEFGLNLDADRGDLQAASDRVLLFCDPHGRGESKTDYDTVYGAMVDAGIDIFNAAGDESVIHRAARINMMNALFDPQIGEARLCIARPLGGDIAAPELVDALEKLERDARGRAERGPKDETDQTHPPVSCGYALWPFEAPAVAAITRGRVLKLVRGAA